MGEGYAALLEQLLVAGVLRPEDKARAERLGDGGTPSPLLAWLEAGLLDADAAADVVAKHYGTVALGIDHHGLDSTLHREVPEPLAQRVMAVPLYHDPQTGVVRTAVVDPFYAGGLRELERALGAPLELVVASLHEVIEAMRTLYGSSKVPAPMPGDATTRLDLSASTDGFAGSSTAPMVRFDRSVPEGLRCEALLQVLISKGVLSYEDYTAALKQLLDRGGVSTPPDAAD